MVRVKTAAVLAMSFLAVVTAAGLFSIYMTGKVVLFSSTGQAVIEPPLMILYDEFNGSTTNFSALSEAELGNITNLTLEVTGIGKVVFEGETNLTVDIDKYNQINLDEHAEFASGSVDIDTGSLTSLKKPATIYMYGLAFVEPRIIVDGSLCPPSSCEILNYSGGNLTFRVPEFSLTYRVEETAEEPVEEEADDYSPPSSISGLVKSSFVTDKDFLKVSLRQGETLLEYVKVSNDGGTVLDFNVSGEGLEGIMEISEKEFTLKADESKTLTISFAVPEDHPPGIYTGKLTLEAGRLTGAVHVLVDAKRTDSLLDIYVVLTEVPVVVYPGGEVDANITIYNLNYTAPIHAKLFYSLRDFEGNDILYKYDDITITGQEILKRRIRVPDDSKPGAYMFYAMVVYENRTLSSGSPVNVRTDGLKDMWEIYTDESLLGVSPEDDLSVVLTEERTAMLAVALAVAGIGLSLWLPRFETARKIRMRLRNIRRAHRGRKKR